MNKKIYYVAIILLTALIIGSMPSPALALFTNGGFETGDWTGWIIETDKRPKDSADPADIIWGNPYTHARYSVIDNTYNPTTQDIDIDPYSGNYMARINDIYGTYHATRLSQTDSITQADIDAGLQLQVIWGALLVEPTNSDEHTDEASGSGINQPYFSIDVLINGTLADSFYADALAHDTPGSGWTEAGYWMGELWYKKNTWTYDLGALSVDDEVTIRMMVADCGLGAHGGYAYLDGIGISEPTDNVIPEPTSLLLLGSGLLGFIGLRRKKK